MASGASDVFFLEGVPPSIKVDGLVSPVAGADALDAVAMRAVIEGPRTGVLFDLKGKTAYPLPMKSRISSKGQVTVPVEIREQLGLVPGTDVQFLVREGEAVLRKGGGGAIRSIASTAG